MNKDKLEKARQKVGASVLYKSYGKFETKSVDKSADGEMVVRGFFTDDNIDEVGDIITKEATLGAIDKYRKFGAVRTMHDYPSGRVERIGKGDGLKWNEIETVPVDEQTIKLIKGGVLKAFSVGIMVRDFDFNEDIIDEDTDPWFWPLIINEYDLVEISYVDHPANYAAEITDIGKGVAKGISKAVLFKSIGERDEVMNENEKEVEAAEEVEEAVEVEKEMEEAEVEAESVEEEEVVEVEEVEEVEVEEVEEKELDSESESDETPYDAESVVQGINVRLDDLERMFDEDFIGSVVEQAVSEIERLYNLGQSETEEDEAVEEKAVDAEVVDVIEETPEAEETDVEPETEKVDLYIDGRLETIVKRVVDELEARVPAALIRTASVVAPSEETPEAKPKSALDKYLDMSTAERREHMKEAVEKSL